MLRWIGIGVLAITISFGFGGGSSFAELKNRKVSDYKTFTEICLDRENLPKATKESIENLLLFYSRNVKQSCHELGRIISTIPEVRGISDLNLLRFTPNVSELSIDDDKVVSDFSTNFISLTTFSIWNCCA